MSMAGSTGAPARTTWPTLENSTPAFLLPIIGTARPPTWAILLKMDRAVRKPSLPAPQGRRETQPCPRCPTLTDAP
jgi:hypothetical protein